MPTYTFRCPCGEVKDAFRSIANREDGPICECGQKMAKIITPVNIAPILGGGDMPGYKCPVTDQYVTSRRQRRNIMAEHDLVEKG